MDKKIKSAYELAMEKLAEKDPDFTQKQLSEEQRRNIAEVRANFEAKIAERKIMLTTQLKKLSLSVPPEQVYEKRTEFEQLHRDEIKDLEEQMHKEINRIRR